MEFNVNNTVGNPSGVGESMEAGYGRGSGSQAGVDSRSEAPELSSLSANLNINSTTVLRHRSSD